MLIKRPNVGGLIATTALNTKINENQNKIPNVSDLVILVVQLPGTSGLVTKQNIILKYQTLRKKYFNASDLDKKKQQHQQQQQSKIKQSNLKCFNQVISVMKAVLKIMACKITQFAKQLLGK